MKTVHQIRLAFPVCANRTAKFQHSRLRTQLDQEGARVTSAAPADAPSLLSALLLWDPVVIFSEICSETVVSLLRFEK